MSYGTFSDNLARFNEPKQQETKPSRKSPHLPQHEAGRMAREVMGTTESTLDDILASVAAEQKRRTKLPLAAGFHGFDNRASWLIKGLLPATCTASIYGPSGSFKSFAAVSWACHIATGKPWNGAKVEQGAVLYVVGEGGVGVPRRIRAWADEYNEGRDVPNVYRVDMPVFMADPSQQAELRFAVEEVKEATGQDVKLIIIDTVARCFGGADENRAADMGAFISGCDLVKTTTGATILLVHHTGKNESNGARGSSSFRAALDAEYLVKREAERGNSLVLTGTKMKDSEQPEPVAFDLKRRVIGMDEDGDELTSLVVIDRGREPADPEADGLAPLSKALFQTIRALTDKNGETTKSEIRNRFKDVTINGSKPNMSNFGRHLKTLEADGLIVIDGDCVTLAKHDEPVTSGDEGD